MFEVTDNAKNALNEVFQSETAKDKQLVIYFQGYG